MSKSYIYIRPGHTICSAALKYDFQLNNSSAGVFHFIEHLILNRVKTILKDEIDNGIRLNARTDVNSLSITLKGFEKEILKSVLKIKEFFEVFNFEFNCEEYSKEKNIILDEVDRAKNLNKLILKKIISSSGDNSLKSFNIIGEKTDIYKINLSEVNKIAKDLFSPMNCRLYVIGSLYLSNEISKYYKTKTNDGGVDETLWGGDKVHHELNLGSDLKLNYMVCTLDDTLHSNKKQLLNFYLSFLVNELSILYPKQPSNFVLSDEQYILWSFSDLLYQSNSIEFNRLKEFRQKYIAELYFKSSNIDYLMTEFLKYGEISIDNLDFLSDKNLLLLFQNELIV